MFRYIIYAILIYLVYLAIKWAFRLGAASKKESKSFKKRNNFKNIEEAEYKEVKKDSPDTH